MLGLSERYDLLFVCIETLTAMLKEKRIGPSLFLKACLAARDTLLHLLDVLRRYTYRLRCVSPPLLEETSVEHTGAAQKVSSSPRLTSTTCQTSLALLRTKRECRDCITQLLSAVGEHLLIWHSHTSTNTATKEHETDAPSRCILGAPGTVASLPQTNSVFPNGNSEGSGNNGASDWDDWDDDDVEIPTGCDTGANKATNVNAARSVSVEAIHGICMLMSAAEQIVLELKEDSDADAAGIYIFGRESSRRGSLEGAYNGKQNKCSTGAAIPVEILANLSEPHRGVLVTTWKHAKEVKE